MSDSLLTRIQFLLFIVIPFGIALMLLAVLYGCEQKTPESKKPAASITMENLQTAYTKSIKYQNMYSRFAMQADKEKLKNIARLYVAIARSEQIHAFNHANLLHAHGMEPKFPSLDSLSFGTTLQTLKMALSSEELEVASMYPNLIRTAELEKDSLATEQFTHTRDADARQTELLKETLDRGAKISKMPYILCSGCGYIMTTEKTEECPVCQTKKNVFEKV